ncbi:hypothetical protein DVR12_27380 [Chitinophaga silvatica]|uniref:Sigma-70, region 4 n=1 Tax=Chitinophaga silvatica TaxID=2282649 RepID=A0A3E1Y1V2_9BACT|nr:hypothetical protein DVR12_27380 [Chitinophaga silvatica]
MTLHFHYGLNLKEIASRFTAPYQQISQEVQESIFDLQRMILRIKLLKTAFVYALSDFLLSNI